MKIPTFQIRRFEIPFIPWPRWGSLVEHLYIHVPFCIRKCPYCAFYSITDFTEELQQLWAGCLISEIYGWLDRLARPLKTIYIGGGTPTTLPLQIWEWLISKLEAFGLWPADEITIECNPGALSIKQIELFKIKGINRVSIGVQSFKDQELIRLGRVHTSRQIYETIELLRFYDIEQIGIDLIFGIPGQSLEQFQFNVLQAIQTGCEHLSCYELTIEEDTPFFKSFNQGELIVDDEENIRMYDWLSEYLPQAGFIQYEISNWAKLKPQQKEGDYSYICRHNLAYWAGEFYLGCGPSASSFIDGVRWTNVADIHSYCATIANGKAPPVELDMLSPLERAAEIAAFGLRRIEGWENEEFLKVTGFSLLDHWNESIQKLQATGWIVVEQDRIRLTSKGLRFADAVARELLFKI